MRGLPFVKLEQYEPSAAELSEAKRLRSEADEKKLRSINTSLITYCKKHQQEYLHLSDGELKEKIVLNFMALQLRTKNGSKSISYTSEVKIRKSKFVERHHWNRFQMDREMGPDVGPYWRESGCIVPQPCPLTGSEKPEHQIWPVPKLWESMNEEDFKSLRLETESQAQAGDENNLELFAAMNSDVALKIANGETDTKEALKASSSSSSTGPSRIKQEVKTPEEILKEQCEKLAENPSCWIREFNDIKADCLTVLQKAEKDKTDNPYASMLCSSLEGIINKVSVIVQIFEAMMRKAATMETLKELKKDIDNVKLELEDSNKWAGRFGYIEGPKKSKRPRKS